jgi:hypothetical protein
MWRERCADKHGHDLASRRHRRLELLIPRVRKVFEAKPQISYADLSQIPETIQEILDRSPREIQNWLSIAEPLVEVNLRELEERGKLQPDIRQFFTRLAPGSAAISRTRPHSPLIAGDCAPTTAVAVHRSAARQASIHPRPPLTHLPRAPAARSQPARRSRRFPAPPSTSAPSSNHSGPSAPVRAPSAPVPTLSKRAPPTRSSTSTQKAPTPLLLPSRQAQRHPQQAPGRSVWTTLPSQAAKARSSTPTKQASQPPPSPARAPQRTIKQVPGQLTLPNLPLQVAKSRPSASTKQVSQSLPPPARPSRRKIRQVPGQRGLTKLLRTRVPQRAASQLARPPASLLPLLLAL